MNDHYWVRGGWSVARHEGSLVLLSFDHLRGITFDGAAATLVERIMRRPSGRWLEDELRGEVSAHGWSDPDSVITALAEQGLVGRGATTPMAGTSGHLLVLDAAISEDTRRVITQLSEIPVKLSTDVTAVDAHDTVLLFLDLTYDPRVHRKLNATALSAGGAFLSARAGGAGVEIGPFSMRGIHACFECYFQRAWAGAVRGELEPLDALPEMWRTPSPIHLALGAWSALVDEYARLRGDLAGPPMTIGAVSVTSRDSGRQSVHPVVELPECDVCRPGETAVPVDG